MSVVNLDPKFISILSKLLKTSAETDTARLVVRKKWHESLLSEKALRLMNRKNDELNKIYKKAEKLAKELDNGDGQHLKNLEHAYSRTKKPEQTFEMPYIARQIAFLIRHMDAYGDYRWIGVLKLSERVFHIARKANDPKVDLTAYTILQDYKNAYQTKTHNREIKFLEFIEKTLDLLKQNAEHAKYIVKTYELENHTNVDRTPPSIQIKRKEAFDAVEGKSPEEIIDAEIKRLLKGKSLRPEYLWAAVRTRKEEDMVEYPILNKKRIPKTKNKKSELILDKERLSQFRTHILGSRKRIKKGVLLK